MVIECPQWVREAVFYAIFPDRFARGTGIIKPNNLESWDSAPTVHGFKGGDLYGIIEHLDYIEDLGINALYLTPIFTSTANHRYHTHDYFTVDPILGGNKALRCLLDEAHRRGMRVMLDAVFNHASRGFYQFNHTLENGKMSPYVDWFHFNQEWLSSGQPLRAYDYVGMPIPEPTERRGLESFGYQAWWDLPELPRFNMKNPQVRDFLLEVARFWIDFGIDGWRLDVPEEIDYLDFWADFRNEVRKVNPEAYLVGEIWHDAIGWLNGDRFDAVMNYIVGLSVLCFFGGKKMDTNLLCLSGYADPLVQPGRDIAPIDANTLAADIKQNLSLHSREINEVQFNLVTTHDTPRLLSIMQGDTVPVKMIMLFLNTFLGAPCIYYGDEIGLQGRENPGCRGAFPWDESKWDNDLRACIKRYTKLRHQRRSLQYGDFNILMADGDVFIYSRQHEDEITVVVFNIGNKKQSVTFTLPEQKDIALVSPWDNDLHIKATTGVVNLELSPRSEQVLMTV